MAIPRPIFGGEIDGKSANSYMGVDRNIDDVQGRIEYVTEKLNIVIEGDLEFTNDKFLMEVWDMGICKSELNTTDFLWSETNVAKILESLASYILYADDEKQYRNEVDYKIYYDENEFNKAIIKDEKLINDRGRELYNNDNGNSMKILIPNDNYKLVPKDKITKSDMYRHPKIKEYNDFIEYLKFIKDDVDFRMSKGIEISDSKIKKMINFLRIDMLDMKYHYHQYLKPKHLLKDDGYPSWEKFDELDREHVKALLQVHRDMELVDFQNDVTCMVYDLSNVLPRVKLTDAQREILELWRRGFNQMEIADMLSKTQQNVSKMLNRIVDKIILVYEEDYKNWYYLNICKGEYKTCTKCGEVKLIDNFGVDKREKEGYRSTCKICRK